MKKNLLRILLVISCFLSFSILSHAQETGSASYSVEDMDPDAQGEWITGLVDGLYDLFIPSAFQINELLPEDYTYGFLLSIGSDDGPNVVLCRFDQTSLKQTGLEAGLDSIYEMRKSEGDDIFVTYATINEIPCVLYSSPATDKYCTYFMNKDNTIMYDLMFVGISNDEFRKNARDMLYSLTVCENPPDTPVIPVPDGQDSSDGPSDKGSIIDNPTGDVIFLP